MPSGAENSFVSRRARTTKALLYSPGIILLASASRLLLITDYSTTNASTIASEVGIAGTLLGTLIPLIPPYLPIATVAAAIFRQWILAVILLIATLGLSPAYMPGLREVWSETYRQAEAVVQLLRDERYADLWAKYPAAVLSASIGVGFLLLMTPSLLNAAESLPSLVFRFVAGIPYFAVVAATSAFLTLAIHVTYQVPFNYSIVSEIGRRPWLPPEEIRLRSGVLEVGYTLQQDVNWHIVLREEDRTIIYMRSDDIVSRTGCVPVGRVSELRRLPLVPAKGSKIIFDKPCVSSTSMGS